MHTTVAAAGILGTVAVVAVLSAGALTASAASAQSARGAAGLTSTGSPAHSMLNATFTSSAVSVTPNLGIVELILTGNGTVLLTIVADTCGRHDTLGGACAKESNVVRYGEHTRHQHACRTTFLRQAARRGLDKRHMHACRSNFLKAIG